MSLPLASRLLDADSLSGLRKDLDRTLYDNQGDNSQYIAMALAVCWAAGARLYSTVLSGLSQKQQRDILTHALHGCHLAQLLA